MNQKKTKITFLTIADMGTISNLKTRNSKPILEALKKIDPETQLICRDYKKYNHKNKNKCIPGGKLIPQLITLAGKIVPIKRRIITLKAMDLFTAKKINKESNILVTYPAGFFKTINGAKRQKMTTVIVEDVAHPKSSHEIMKQISKKHKLNKNRVKLANETDYTITFSDFSRQTYVDNGFPEDKVFAVPTGTDIEKFRPGTKEDDLFRVIAVGNYNNRKGFQYLLKTWENLKLENAELVIVGNPQGEMKKIIKEYRKKLSNLRVIYYTTDVVRYYQNSSVFILPSLLEGSARVVYEAMACELPVICTPETGSVIENEKEGYIIPSKDVSAIEKAILKLYNNPEHAKQLGKRGRKKIVEKYQWKHFSDRVHTVIKEIIRKERLD